MAALEQMIVDHLSSTHWTNLPRTTVDATKRSILDTLAAIVAGSTADDIDRLVTALQTPRGAAQATILVYGSRVSAPDAAWANGAMARAREFDDSHDPTGDHTSVPILSAALALAELAGPVSGREFITAYALAADMTARLRMAPSRKVGGTAFAANTYAPFSAAVAGASLLKLNGESMYDALAWAYSQAAGSVQLQQSGGSALHIHHGMAAAAGVRSSLLAKQGFHGMSDCLTGKFGLYNAYEAGEFDESIITKDLGTSYLIDQVSLKQYPAGRVTHGPIEAAIELHHTANMMLDQIDRVDVVYTRGGFNMTCEPEADRRTPTNTQDAKFSLYYNVACALARGHVTLADFSPEAVADPGVAALTKKIHVHVDPELTSIIPPGRLTVVFTDGTAREAVVPELKGTPANPVSLTDCAEKFRLCLPYAARDMSSKSDELIDSIVNFEQLEDVGAWLVGHLS